MIRSLSEVDSVIDYDHLLCSMSRVIHDARTLNLADSLALKGERVAVLAYANEDDVRDLTEQDLKFDVFFIPWPNYDRMFKLWISFLYKSISVKSKIRWNLLWAMDLYSVPFTLILKSLSKGNIIYDAREIYTALGTNVDQPAKQRIISLVEKMLIHKVSKVVVTGKLDGTFLTKEYGVEEPEVLLNLPKLKNWTGNKRLRRELGIDDNHSVIIYQGLIYKGRGVDRIIEALPYLDNVTFVAIGQGAKADIDKCMHLAKKAGVEDRFKWKAPVPYAELMNWTAEADLGVCFIEPLTLSLRYALPNKLFEYCMAGIPVLATDLPQMKAVLNEIPAGRYVSPNINAVKLASEIGDMLKSKNNGNFAPYIQQMRNQYHWDAQMSAIDRLIGQ